MADPSRLLKRARGENGDGATNSSSGGSSPSGGGVAAPGGAVAGNQGAVSPTIQVMQLAVDHTSLYWIDVQIHAHQMPKAGGPDSIIDGTSELDDIAPANNGLYYETSTVNTPSELVFHSAAGSNPVSVPSGFGLQNSFVDDSNVYGSDGDSVAAYNFSAGTWTKAVVAAGGFLKVVGTNASHLAVVLAHDDGSTKTTICSTSRA